MLAFKARGDKTKTEIKINLFHRINPCILHLQPNWEQQNKLLVKMMQLAEALAKMSHLSPVEKQLVAWAVDNSGQAEGSPRALPHITQP